MSSVEHRPSDTSTALALAVKAATRAGATDSATSEVATTRRRLGRPLDLPYGGLGLHRQAHHL